MNLLKEGRLDWFILHLWKVDTCFGIRNTRMCSSLLCYNTVSILEAKTHFIHCPDE